MAPPRLGAPLTTVPRTSKRAYTACSFGRRHCGMAPAMSGGPWTRGRPIPSSGTGQRGLQFHGVETERLARPLTGRCWTGSASSLSIRNWPAPGKNNLCELLLIIIPCQRKLWGSNGMGRLANRGIVASNLGESGRSRVNVRRSTSASRSPLDTGIQQLVQQQIAGNCMSRMRSDCGKGRGGVTVFKSSRSIYCLLLKKLLE